MTQRRIYQCDLPYHITFNTLNREWVFEDQEKAELLHEIILNAGDLKNHIVYQFAIMPDHVHLLCQTGDVGPPRGLENPRYGGERVDAPRGLESPCCGGSHIFRSEGFPTCGVKKNPNISDFVKSIRGTFAKQVNSGQIWQPRFHDEIIQTDEQMQTVVDYITYNPIKADLPKKWEEYPYQYINWELLNELS